MKKIIFLVFLMILFIVSTTTLLGYDSTLNGIYGYIITPTAIPLSSGSFMISSGYIFTPGNLFISALVSFLPNWELGFAKEFNFTNPNYISPFIFTTKYRFFKGKISASFGMILEMVPTNTGYINLEAYIAIHSYSIFGSGVMDVVIGKDFRFGQDINSLINIYIGTKIPLIAKNLYLIADFSNTTHRFGNLGYMNDDRGVFNIGLYLKLMKTLSIYFVTFDFLDYPFTALFMFGANLNLSL